MKKVTRYITDAYDEDEDGDFVFYSDFEEAQEELGRLDAEIIFLKHEIATLKKRYLK